MTDPTAAVTGRWLHSFEEDHGDVTVYRPPDHDFPPARGRRGIEFSPDGSFTEWVIGRGDAPQAVPGQGRPAAARRLGGSPQPAGDPVLQGGPQGPARLEVGWREAS